MSKNDPNKDNVHHLGVKEWTDLTNLLFYLSMATILPPKPGIGCGRYATLQPFTPPLPLGN